MDFDWLDEFEGLQKDVFYLTVCFLIIGATAAAANYYTPDENLAVGNVELETNCAGIDVGFCIGVQRQSLTTYNYDDYEDPEPGTEDFYRRVESELMVQAHNICDQDTLGMEWLSEAEYRNQTGTEWSENENVQLLPCEQTFYRNMTAKR